MKQFSSVDEYIASFPPEIQERLQTIRSTIRGLAPEAQEVISYGMPTYKLNGTLAHYAAFQSHIGFYPTPVGLEQFQQQLEGYKTGKGSVQFPHNQPLPLDLITNIVLFRIQDNLEKKKK